MSCVEHFTADLSLFLWKHTSNVKHNKAKLKHLRIAR